MDSSNWSYFESEKLLHLSQGLLDPLRSKIDVLDSLLKAEEDAKKGHQELLDCSQKAVDALSSCSDALSHRDFTKAECALDSLEALASSPCVISTPVSEEWKEMASWARLAVRRKQWEEAKQPNEKEVEEMRALLLEADALPLGLHSSSEKEAQKDHCFRSFALYALRVYVPKEDLTALTHMTSLLSSYGKEAKKEDPRDVEVMRDLSLATSRLFNRLAYDALSPSSTYEQARLLFPFRDQIPLDRIQSPLYAQSKSEDEFCLGYHRFRLENDDGSFFASKREMWAASLIEEDDFSLRLLSASLMDPSLNSTTRESLFLLFNESPFQSKILVLFYSVSSPASKAMLGPIYASVLADVSKRLDIEKCTDALSACLSKAPKEYAASFHEMVQGLLRSPKAHRVVYKSASPELYRLKFGRERKSPSVGGKAKSAVVSYWGVPTGILYYTFAVSLPLLLCCLSLLLLELNRSYVSGEEYWVLLPWGLALCYASGVFCTFFGRDEKPSWWASRALAFDGLWKALLSLLCFLFPSFFGGWASHRVSLFLLVFLDFALSRFVFKDKSKGWRYGLFLPTLALEIASFVFLILFLMGLW